MAAPLEDVYATLLLNDSYLPGALVLAHSLKDAGTTKKLAVLVTVDNMSVDAMVELQKLYDFIVPVDRIRNQSPANLFLMGRSDLHSAFTKIELWKQEQFRKIVYMDADMVALRAPDELFHLPHPFSAAPDIGWPDLFNSGLMVLSPNMGDYYAMSAMATRGISFDGADQGLLNMHFKNNYNRLSFTYNVTPSAHYQYLPAYRHFQSSVSAAHFIGKNKPWNEGRDAHTGNDPYSEMVGRWWAVYDRHFRAQKSIPYVIQYNVKGEYKEPNPGYGHAGASSASAGGRLNEAASSQQTEREIPAETSPEANADEPLHETAEVVQEKEEAKSYSELPKQEFVAPMHGWDASRAPPPADSRPEAMNFPSAHYEMSTDKKPFKAPGKYPEPPKNMWYDVPKTPTYQKPKPIFPWENNAAKPTRVFDDDEEALRESISAHEEILPAKPESPAISITTSDPWTSFQSTSGNAWDDIPEIQRYIGKLQKNRKGNIQVLQGYGAGIQREVSSPGGDRALRLTDFPTEMERPSLPVTPAPIRRPSFWGEERDSAGNLPEAEGVPSQAEWDPIAQLDQLARRQSEVLANKLGTQDLKELPQRALPYGSEGVKSPTYVAPTAPKTSNTQNDKQPVSMSGASFEKDETFPTHSTPLPPSEEELDVLQT